MLTIRLTRKGKKNQPFFRVVVIGDPGVGKTAFMGRHTRPGKFERNYSATIGVHEHQLSFYTDLGRVVFEVCDIAGNEEFEDLDDAELKLLIELEILDMVETLEEIEDAEKAEKEKDKAATAAEEVAPAEDKPEVAKE